MKKLSLDAYEDMKGYVRVVESLAEVLIVTQLYNGAF